MVASSDTINLVVATYLQAAELNRATPARDGNVVSLSSDVADDVMITGDLHGQRLHFNKLCRIADLESNPRRHLVLQEVCHGGPLYPSSNGCMSHLLLEDVARLKVQYPERFHFLLSNHELAELNDYPIAKAGQMLNLQFRAGLKKMYGDAMGRVRDALAEFLSTCPLSVRLASGVFVCHGVPQLVDEDGFDVDVLRRPLTEDDISPDGAAFRLVWGRDFRLENAEAFARLVGANVLIHGHEPCADGFATPNERQVILDCAGPNACYLIVPAGGTITYEEITARIRRLNAGATDGEQ